MIGVVEGDAGCCGGCQLDIAGGEGVGAAVATGDGEFGDINIVVVTVVCRQVVAAESKNAGGTVVSG